MTQSNKRFRAVRRYPLAGVSLLAMLVGANSAGAQSFTSETFNYGPTTQDFVAPVTGNYLVIVGGAQGGTGGNSFSTHSGGVGLGLSRRWRLTAHQ